MPEPMPETLPLKASARLRAPSKTGEVLLTGGSWAAATLVAAVFFAILLDVVSHGIGSLSWEFVTAAPRDAGRAGGIGPILVSTAMIVGLCTAITLPLGLGTAVLLSEFVTRRGRFGRAVRRSLDVLAGVPSIVFGLFGNAFFCELLGMGFSILAGALTLSCMVLPIFIRAAEEGLRSVPNEHRQAAAALGISRGALLRVVLLPAAAPGLVVGLVLGLGRALAETAALLFTSGYVDRTPSSIWDSGRALSVHIYDLSMNVAGGAPHAYASALVLVLALAIINLAVSFAGERWTRRALRR